VSGTQRPLVYVLTPVYNGEAYLEECIESVLAQTYPYWEHLILDNQSTDRTQEIARRYAARDHRIRLVRTDRFVDVIENHNTACRSVPAEASYVKFVHADDWLFPACLEEMVRVAEANPSVGLVSAYRLEGTDVTITGLPYEREVFSGSEVCRLCLLHGYPGFGSPSAHLLRAEVVRERDPYFDGARFSTHADSASCYDVLRQWDQGFVHQVLTFTRRHDESVSSGARRLNTSIGAGLRILTTYGPHYLDQAEYAERLDERMRAYYNYLARCMFHWRDNDFWRYHGEMLADAGHRLSYAGLAWAGIREVMETSPADLVRKARRFVGRTGRRQSSTVAGKGSAHAPQRGPAA
jgi:glycosyltransferase involved in cell wall biosynthesis